MSGGLVPNSQTFLAWNKLMIDMSNIFFSFFYPFSSLFRKSPKCQQQQNVYILNELHTTDKF